MITWQLFTIRERNERVPPPERVIIIYVYNTSMYMYSYVRLPIEHSLHRNRIKSHRNTWTALRRSICKSRPKYKSTHRSGGTNGGHDHKMEFLASKKPKILGNFFSNIFYRKTDRIGMRTYNRRVIVNTIFNTAVRRPTYLWYLATFYTVAS